MLYLLLLFSSLLQAEDLSSEKYCFPSVAAAQMAQKKFSAIQVNSDTVSLDENCLVVQMRPHRFELVQKYMLSTYPGVSITFSSENLKRDPCFLKVEKVKTKTSNELNAGIEKTVDANATTTDGEATEVMQIQTLKEFELSVDQDQIKGSCRYINPRRYEITLEVRKNPKPIVPVQLPPGTIIVMNQAPPDQETMTLQTQLQLNKGERIEIGEILKKAKNKENHLDVKTSLKIETDNQSSSEKVFLSLQ